MPELIFDDYVTRDDGRRSAIGHHHDSGADDHAASWPTSTTPPAKDAAERYWAEVRRSIDDPTMTNRIREIRSGSPLTESDAPIILAAIRRSCVAGMTSYQLCRWFRFLDLRYQAWHVDITLNTEDVDRILAALLAAGQIFAVPCAQIPWDDPKTLRPFPTARYYASDYPDFI